MKSTTALRKESVEQQQVSSKHSEFNVMWLKTGGDACLIPFKGSCVTLQAFI